MKLLLIRHGKSSWDIPGQPDFNRPLAMRGHRQLKELAALMIKEGIIPSKIAVSPAVRTQLSAAVLHQAGWGQGSVQETEESLYEATTPSILRMLKTKVAECESLAIIGHNPWLNEVIELYTGIPIDNLKTSGAVLLEWGPSEKMQVGAAKLIWSHRLSS